MQRGAASTGLIVHNRVTSIISQCQSTYRAEHHQRRRANALVQFSYKDCRRIGVGDAIVLVIRAIVDVRLCPPYVSCLRKLQKIGPGNVH